MRIAVAALFQLRIGVSLVAAIVPVTGGAAHLLLVFLAFFRIHAAEPGLQGLGGDGDGQDENQ